MRQRIYILLFCTLTLQSVAFAEALTVTCGTEIVVKAEPLSGYHFVQWSDGDTAMQRTIEVMREIQLLAIFAPDCELYTNMPITAVAQNIFVVALGQLATQGFIINPEDITWYRVVGEIDDPRSAAPRTDQPVAEGATLMIENTAESAGSYYAEVDVSETYSGKLCYDIMRSNVVQFTPMEEVFAPVVFPTLVHMGTNIIISNLSPDEKTTISLLDIHGQLSRVPYNVEGQTYEQMAAPTLPGIYLLRISSASGERTYRVIVRK